MAQFHIVALGGTQRPESSTCRALSAALRIAEARGARTTMLTGADIAFPNLEDGTSTADPAVARFLETIRSADAVIIGSPGYHGSLSGMVKNALDHVELTRGDPRVYFDGMPVGLIATAAGWQAAVSTLQTLRTITHALRGWPTPIGIAINSAEQGDPVGACEPQMTIMIEQMLGFLAR